MTGAMSISGSPKRFIGFRFTCFAYSSGNFSAQAFAAGDSAPGRTMFTQMPYWPHSLAAIFVRPRSASLFEP